MLKTFQVYHIGYVHGVFCYRCTWRKLETNLDVDDGRETVDLFVFVAHPVVV